MDGVRDMLDKALEWQPPSYINACLKYKSTSYVQIDYPVVGAVNRGLQIAILALTLFQLFSEKTWAYSETPLGTVNAFGGPGQASTAYSKVQAEINALTQCNNASHAFQYDPFFNYTTPECRYVVPEQLVVKGTQQVQFVTQFLENEYTGFPCATPGPVGSKKTEAGCKDAGGSVDKHANGQCVCKVAKTVYPIGVEDMVMSFEHTYEFPVGKFGLKDWRGASTLSAEQVASEQTITSILPSSVAVADGEPVHIQEGSSVSQPIKNWLRAAQASLDDVNKLSSQDQLARPGSDGKTARLPHFRMTGMVITILIDYSNGEPTVTQQKHIYANITATKQLLAWAGPGSERVHVEYPTGSLGAQTFQYVDRYQQGIVFDFQPTGRVYVFDWQHVLNTLIGALVLLGFAATVTDTFAFYMLPNGHSAVLAAHRQVVVNKKQGFAELGMRTALAAKFFAEAFDPDHNEIIEAEDIVRVLAQVQGDTVTYTDVDPETGEKSEKPLDCDKAHAIALAILMDQNVSRGEQATMDSFTFGDFMRTQDNGTIPFPEFMSKVKIPENSPWTPTEEQREACRVAWNEGLRTEGAKKKQKTLRRKASQKGSMAPDQLDVSIVNNP